MAHFLTTLPCIQTLLAEHSKQLSVLTCRSLRCTRNFIHVNLMISFVLRYAFQLVDDQVAITPAKLPNISQVVEYVEGNYTLMDTDVCRKVLVSFLLCSFSHFTGKHTVALLSLQTEEKGNIHHYCVLNLLHLMSLT